MSTTILRDCSKNIPHFVADSVETTGLKWVAPAAGGKVLQVLTQTFTTEVTSSSATLADTGITLNITPSSASSKVLVLLTVAGCRKDSGNSGNRFEFSLLRSATKIGGLANFLWTNTDMLLNSIYATTVLDSPNTTSSTTYKLQFANSNGSGTVRINSQAPSDISTITLLEIGA